ncbi:MAG: hypothetical protein Q8L81_01605 [Bacteroidota bacterium]|nr:hypothetical protein [Bacteroidota bacterium]
MEDDKINKLLGINSFNRINSLENKLKHLDGLSKLANISNPMQNHMKQMNSFLKVSDILNSVAPKQSMWDYISNPTKNMHFMFDAVKEKANNDSLKSKIIFGGSTVSDIAKYINANETASKVSKSMLGLNALNDITQTVNRFSNAYDKQLSITEGLFKSYSQTKHLNLSGNLSELFNGNNFYNRKKVNAFDVLSGSAFTNIARLYEASPESASLEEELGLIEEEFKQNPYLIKEVQNLMDAVCATESETYKKWDDKLTEWVDALTRRFGWSKQKAYYIAFMIGSVCSIIIGVSAKAVYDSYTKKPQIVINAPITINKNMYVSNEKFVNDIIFKQAPVYPKNLTSTRKLGVFKENAVVKIIQMKNGWCNAEGLVEIIKKQNGKKIKSDSLMRVWVQQIYLKSFQ